MMNQKAIWVIPRLCGRAPVAGVTLRSRSMSVRESSTQIRATIDTTAAVKTPSEGPAAGRA